MSAALRDIATGSEAGDAGILESIANRIEKVPLEVKITVCDAMGREQVYASTWQLAESAPGAKGLRLYTGLTDADAAGVRGEVEIRVGL